MLAASNVLARTAACPCSNPCPCAPCKCGGGKSSSSKPPSNKSGSDTTEKPKTGTAKTETPKTGTGTSKTDTPKTEPRHADTTSHGKHSQTRHEHGGHDHGGGGVGVGVDVSVDLSGVGRRTAEPDPFAVSGGGVPTTKTAHIPEKQKSKTTQREVTTGDPFNGVTLTGKEAKGDIPPPNVINVSDEVEQPPLPNGEKLNTTPKTGTPMEQLKAAEQAYTKARTDYLHKQPDWTTIAHDLASGSSKDDTKSQAAFKKMKKLIDQFDATEGKEQVNDWKSAYDNAVKAGEKVGNNLIPPPQNGLEKKKYAVVSAQNNLQSERDQYDWSKNGAIARDEKVNEIRKQIEAIEDQYKPTKENKVAAQEKINQLKDELEKARNKAGNEWAASDDAKKQMMKVHEAEQELDKAKQAYKPFEQYEEKPAKAASNP